MRVRKIKGLASALVCFMTGVMLLMLNMPASAQSDPGARPVGNDNPTFAVCPITSAKFPKAPACIDVVQPSPDPNNPATGAGNVLLNAGNQTGMWFQALTVFETKAVVGPVAQTGGATFPGLGPSFNALSCFQCHSQPAVGGSSPNTATPGFPRGNPQTQLQSTAGANGAAPDQTQLDVLTTPPAGTTIPPILSIDPTSKVGTGPVREVRFPDTVAADPTTFTDGVVGGSVAELFAINAAIGAPNNCTIGQFPFAAQLKAGNVIFRIPIPTFGEGLVENTDDTELTRNANLSSSVASNLGITDITFNVFNHSGNDQTIARFGWKAQNKSLLIFAGEASNVEMGVTNENFPNERTHGNGSCSPNFEPEDEVVNPPILIATGSPLNDPRTITDIFNADGSPGVASDISSNIENFAVFMRLNAPPSQCAFNSGLTAANSSGQRFARCFSLSCTSSSSCVNPNPSTAAVNSIQRGKKLFGTLDSTAPGALTPNAIADNNPETTSIKTVGCVLCHSDSLKTTTSQAGSLNNANFAPFSDFALHTMDPALSDRVTQGQAGPQQFRTAPLWGIGQRLFFLHDGRANDLLTAIEDHCINSSATNDSEACTVIANFNNLPKTSTCTNATTGTGCTASKQDVLNFLRSL